MPRSRPSCCVSQQEGRFFFSAVFYLFPNLNSLNALQHGQCCPCSLQSFAPRLQLAPAAGKLPCTPEVGFIPGACCGSQSAVRRCVVLCDRDAGRVQLVLTCGMLRSCAPCRYLLTRLRCMACCGMFEFASALHVAGTSCPHALHVTDTCYSDACCWGVHCPRSRRRAAR